MSSSGGELHVDRGVAVVCQAPHHVTIAQVGDHWGHLLVRPTWTPSGRPERYAILRMNPKP